jgi:hypothetical protein
MSTWSVSYHASYELGASLSTHLCILIPVSSQPLLSIRFSNSAPSTFTMSATPSPLAAGLPPGRAGEPYIISTQDGEIIYIPLSKSATRLLVTGKESDDAFAIVSSGGSQSDPVGFHYHRETHDVFLCLQGNVNIWAGDQCRTLSGGDFASVPPVRNLTPPHRAWN